MGVQPRWRLNTSQVQACTWLVFACGCRTVDIPSAAVGQPSRGPWGHKHQWLTRNLPTCSCAAAAHQDLVRPWVLRNPRNADGKYDDFSYFTGNDLGWNFPVWRFPTAQTLKGQETKELAGEDIKALPVLKELASCGWAKTTRSRGTALLPHVAHMNVAPSLQCRWRHPSLGKGRVPCHRLL